MDSNLATMRSKAVRFGALLLVLFASILSAAAQTPPTPPGPSPQPSASPTPSLERRFFKNICATSLQSGPHRYIFTAMMLSGLCRLAFQLLL
ncbi:MAG: hypothetical protein ABI923_08560 [bacterium]